MTDAALSVLLSRIQFGLTVGFHYIFPPLNIGLGTLMVVMEGLYISTGRPVYKQLARFWALNFGLMFALGGVAVGAASLLWQGLATPRPAYAQVPDSGAQRNDMIRELQESNKKLTEIAGLLRQIRDGQKADKDRKPDQLKP